MDKRLARRLNATEAAFPIPPDEEKTSGVYSNHAPPFKPFPCMQVASPAYASEK